jgi:hypothetical protein
MRMMTPLIVSALVSREREPECLDSHELGESQATLRGRVVSREAGVHQDSTPTTTETVVSPPCVHTTQ